MDIKRNSWGDILIHWVEDANFPNLPDNHEHLLILIEGCDDEANLPIEFRHEVVVTVQYGPIFGNEKAAREFPGLDDHDRLMGAGVAIILTDHSELKVVMVKSSHKQHWTCPIGMAMKGEDFKTCAIREVKEETGLVANPNNLRVLARYFDSITFAGLTFDTITYCYYLVAHQSDINGSVGDLKEIERVAYMDVNDCVNNISLNQLGIHTMHQKLVREAVQRIQEDPEAHRMPEKFEWTMDIVYQKKTTLKKE